MDADAVSRLVRFSKLEAAWRTYDAARTAWQASDFNSREGRRLAMEGSRAMTAFLAAARACFGQGKGEDPPVVARDPTQG